MGRRSNLSIIHQAMEVHPCQTESFLSGQRLLKVEINLLTHYINEAGEPASSTRILSFSRKGQPLKAKIHIDEKPLPSKRSDAVAIGAKWYFTGRACRRGHIAERQAINGSCRECASNDHRKRYSGNPEIRRDYNRSWNELNSEHRKKYNRERLKEWRETPRGKAYEQIRRSIKRVLKGSGHPASISLVGYGPDQLIERIESTFETGMSWENYGEWVVDHIIPVKWFLDQGEYRPSVVNALTNLKAMWFSDNAAKGAKVPDGLIPCHHLPLMRLEQHECTD